MGLDNIYGVGALRPGVCTSSTRPASPFEGQTIYETDTDLVKSYNGSSWVTIGPTPIYNARETVTATNASWSVPTLKNSVVKVTVIGGGGGGGNRSNNGTAGGTTTFASGEAFAVAAAGGSAGLAAGQAGTAGGAGFRASNGGMAGGATVNTDGEDGQAGLGGEILVAYCDLTGKTTLNLIIGAGGNGGAQAASGGGGTAFAGGAGGRGEIIVEYAS
jgi:hypothetical protein